ncbi:uncharacterized protein A4U43_C07F35000 [Asparagus officinalis]|uniref:Uncharacterized protein n=1 Tax=Asparagus officinalis TaxID=4686 RepID=A0A5P1EKA1_ASPOF|nr:uncharacterized protein A4U43_C07F35000 [Asparagus officinalis]
MSPKSSESYRTLRNYRKELSGFLETPLGRGFAPRRKRPEEGGADADLEVASGGEGGLDGAHGGDEVGDEVPVGGGHDLVAGRKGKFGGRKGRN